MKSTHFRLKGSEASTCGSLRVLAMASFGSPDSEQSAEFNTLNLDTSATLGPGFCQAHTHWACHHIPRLRRLPGRHTDRPHLSPRGAGRHRLSAKCDLSKVLFIEDSLQWTFCYKSRCLHWREGTAAGGSLVEGMFSPAALPRPIYSSNSSHSLLLYIIHLYNFIHLSD